MEANNTHPFTEGELKYMTKASIRYHFNTMMMQNGITHGSMLTLMGEDPSFEKDLWRDFQGSLDITSIEQDKDIFEKQKRIIAKQEVPFNLINKDAQTFLLDNKKKFNVVYFDLCSSRTQSTYGMIHLLFQNVFDPKSDESLFSITLSARNEQDFFANQLRATLQERYSKDDPRYQAKLKEGHEKIRNYLVPDHLNKIGWEYGFSLDYCAVHRYRDFHKRKGAALMYTYVFKVINQPNIPINYKKAGLSDLKMVTLK